MSRLEAVTDRNFEEELRRQGVLAVDFSAAWCPPCRLASAVLAELAEEYADSVRVRELDTDVNPATAARFGVRSLPTVVFFREGREVARVVGAVPKPQLQRKFEEALSQTGELPG